MNDDCDNNGNVADNVNYIATNESVHSSQTTCNKSSFKKVQAMLKPMEQHLDGVLKEFNRICLSLTIIIGKMSTQDHHGDFCQR